MRTHHRLDVGPTHITTAETVTGNIDPEKLAAWAGQKKAEVEALPLPPERTDLAPLLPGVPEEEQRRLAQAMRAGLEGSPRERASDITARRVSWLWPNRIALGKLGILDGNPGLGKSLLTLDLAARVSTGRPMPDGSPGLAGPGNVIIITAEDDWEDTVVPRLMAAGANLDRIFPLYDLNLPDGAEALQEAIEDTGAQLVIIDPLVAFVPAKYNLYRDQDARLALRPLAEVMARTGSAAIGLRHVNKAQGLPAQHRGTGSIAIGGAARSNLIVGPDPDLKDSFVLACIKSNLGPPPPSLGYRIVTRSIELEDGSDDIPVIAWGGVVELVADDLVAPEKQGEATRFLEEFLADGAQPSRNVQAAAEARGLSWSGAVRRAADRLGVVKSNPAVGVKGGGWVWSLPDVARISPPAQLAQHAKVGTSQGEQSESQVEHQVELIEQGSKYTQLGADLVEQGAQVERETRP